MDLFTATDRQIRVALVKIDAFDAQGRPSLDRC